MLLECLVAISLAGGWETHGPDLPNVTVVAISASDDRRVYALAGSYGSEIAVFRSDDSGQRWRRIFDAPDGEFLDTLHVDPADADRLFVSAGSMPLGPFGHFTTSLWRSMDGGETWTVRLGVSDASFCSIAYDPALPDAVYASFAGRQSWFFRSEDSGDSFEGGWAPFFGPPKLQVAPDGSLLGVSPGTIWGSQDQGQTWRIPISAPGDCPLTSLAIDTKNPNRLFLSEGSSQAGCGQVLRSVDGGVTWWRTADVGGPVLDLVMDPSDPSLIYVVVAQVGRPGRVLLSDDDGETWKDLGLPASASANNLALTGNGERIYVATPAGVYTRELRRTLTIPARH